jgi:large subunit ribosomal protein L10
VGGLGMNRTDKQTLIDTLHQEFTRSPHAILVDYRGLSVPAVTEFRRKVRAAGSRYRVVKNTLAQRAARGTPLEKLGAKFEQMTGVAYTEADPIALAKALVDFAKDNPALQFKGGIVSGDQVIDAEGVKALSTMPSLPELRAQLLGLLQAPATQLVRLLGTPATQLARVLKSHEEKLEGN